MLLKSNLGRTCTRSGFNLLYVKSMEPNLNSQFWSTGVLVATSTKNLSTEHHLTIDPQITKCDCVGPPDKTSNIRLYKYYIPDDETPLEATYRRKREETQDWNKLFWSSHNLRFKKEKEAFIQDKLREKYGDHYQEAESKYLSAEEMSEFYKSFLEKDLRLHVDYNKEWYRRNFENLFLAFSVVLQRMLKKRLKFNKS